MRRFKAGDKYLCVEPAFYFGGVGTFQKEFDGFFQIGGGGFNRVPLAGHVEFRTERDIAGPFLFDNRRVAARCHPASTLSSGAEFIDNASL
jgi:hypothetical protein